MYTIFEHKTMFVHRCHFAPRIMDNKSGSPSPKESTRPMHRPPSPPGAFENKAFQPDDPSDKNHNESFTSNHTHTNGHTKDHNGDTKALEAVNLELINLTPKNGHPVKDVKVDLNGSNPYDEYFVPVNEHRKYIRLVASCYFNFGYFKVSLESFPDWFKVLVVLVFAWD